MPCLPQTRASNQLASVTADTLLELASFVCLVEAARAPEIHGGGGEEQQRGARGRGRRGGAAAGAGARGVPGGAVRRRGRGAVDVGVQLHRLGRQEGPLLPERHPRYGAGSTNFPSCIFVAFANQLLFFAPHISDRSPLLQCSCTTHRTRRCTRTACT